MGFISKNLEDTKKIAFDFVRSIIDLHEKDRQGATVVGLYGELGSGKTTFMKYLAEALGVKEEITSPTFVIMKKFSLLSKPAPFNFQTLIHIDAYRIEKDEEMLVLGWNDIISDPSNLICVEWPEKIARILPPHIKIFFEHFSEDERKIKIEI